MGRPLLCGPRVDLCADGALELLCSPPRLNSAFPSRAEQAGQDCTGRIKYFPKDEERPISPSEAGPREKAPSSGCCAKHTKLPGLFCAC